MSPKPGSNRGWRISLPGIATIIVAERRGAARARHSYNRGVGSGRLKTGARAMALLQIAADSPICLHYGNTPPVFERLSPRRNWGWTEIFRKTCGGVCYWCAASCTRSEEHASELQSLMRISYAVFCLKKKNNEQI